MCIFTATATLCFAVPVPTHPFADVNLFSITLACALTCGIAAAQAAEPQGPAEELRAQMLRSLHGGVAPAFVLDKELPLDPALRAEADKLGAEHLARVDTLLSAWVDEERTRQTRAGKAPPLSAVYYPVLARLLNELSLWQLEPGDAHYESTTLAVLRSAARVCDLSGDYRLTDFASRILRIQALPAAERKAMLASERELLSHWGRPRAEPPPWPDPLPQQAAFALLQRGPADADHPRLALPPRLAAAALGFGRDYTAMHPVERCALQQWWLQESLRAGATPAAALNAFRYGTMLTAVDRFGDAPGEPGAADGKDRADRPPYPGVASRFHATGVTTVSVRLDATGRPLQATVTGRKIDVPGIHGVRPVAFENVFDATIEKYATREGRQYGKPSGNVPYTFQMVWKLDDDRNAKAAQGARQ